jgi:hypothetical protein
MSLEKRIERLEQEHETEEGGIKWVLMCYAGEEPPPREDIKRAEQAYIERFGDPRSSGRTALLRCQGGIISAEMDPGVVLGTYQVVVRPQGLPGQRQP